MSTPVVGMKPDWCATQSLSPRKEVMASPLLKNFVKKNAVIFPGSLKVQ